MGRSDNRGSDRNVRRYKVTCFGEDLGTFTLPIGEHLENPEAFLRPILCKPYRDGEGEDATYFWAEPDSGATTTVYWEPETAAQAEEAERFYRTAHGLNPDGSLDPAKQRPVPVRGAEEMRLIRAVLAKPDDEQPYLDYAGWLAGRGEPYAEYIRLSLRMEPLAEDDEFRERLDDRLHELGEKHGAKWIRGLTELGLFPGDDENHDERAPDAFDPNEWFDDKGVISHLTIPGGTFVFRTNPARLFAAAPFLRSLSLHDPALSLAAAAALPQMAQINWLHLMYGAGTEDDFQRFADSPHFAALRWLILYSYGMGPVSAQAFAEANWMRNLRGLYLEGNPTGNEGAEALAASGYCANLEELNLAHTELSDHGLTALCRSPHLSKLETLNLEHNTFTADGMRELVAATFAPKLDYLDLPDCGLDEAAIAQLATGTFPALKVLDVSGHLVGDAPMRALIAAPFFRALDVFWANGCDLGTAALGVISRLGFTNLEDLSLSNNRIDMHGIAVLMGSKVATKLRTLHLAYNPLGADGVVELASAELPALEYLDLSGIRLGKEAISALVRAPWRKNLAELIVSEDEVSERGLERLTERFGEDVVSAE